MAPSHPLDRAAWSALSGRQSRFALTNPRARRFAPPFGVFAAIGDRSDESLEALGDLVAAFGDVALLEPDPPKAPPGTAVVSVEVGVQMTADALKEGSNSFPLDSRSGDLRPLTDADGPRMLALATLTQPGPFFERTHQLGAFYGVKARDGRLLAMAGERMKPDGFTEVSGVCTHPDARGRGYARVLMRHVAGRILARGETPFLHAYAGNTGAIALYASLGFAVRREVAFLRLTRA